MANLGIFINTNKLIEDTFKLIKHLPEFDYVVTIPRGGIIPSGIISTIMGKPLTTADLLVEGKAWMSSSMAVENKRNLYTEQRYVSVSPENSKILLVDDISYNQLGELERSKRIINAKFPNAKCYKVPIYVVERTRKLNDLYCGKISMSHLFEKDLMTRNSHGVIGYDMDGVLCEDWHSYEKEDSEEYTKFLSEAKPYLIPHYRIDYIITCRLQKYWDATVRWLAEHNVKYKYLIMHPAESKEQRGSHSDFKINMIRKYMKDGLFVESSLRQAKNINDALGTQVICTESKELFYGTDTKIEYNEVMK
jgi:orotate phosphoribosyltransferase